MSTTKGPAFLERLLGRMLASPEAATLEAEIDAEAKDRRAGLMAQRHAIEKQCAEEVAALQAELELAVPAEVAARETYRTAREARLGLQAQLSFVSSARDVNVRRLDEQLREMAPPEIAEAVERWQAEEQQIMRMGGEGYAYEMSEPTMSGRRHAVATTHRSTLRRLATLRAAIRDAQERVPYTDDPLLELRRWDYTLERSPVVMEPLASLPADRRAWADVDVTLLELPAAAA